REKISVLTNGYASEELATVKACAFGHFAIVYAGFFYPPERVITPLLMALKLLEQTCQTGEWFFHYFGDHEEHMRQEARRLGVVNRVILHGLQPRSQVLSAIRGANLAVVITSVQENVSLRFGAMVPGKLFEIIGLGTPILLIAPPGTDAEVILES